MQAFTKNDMKPSRAPCFFSKSSFSRSRSAITLVMSTSLKVVSMAAVFCASLRRLAMVRRSRRHAHAFLAVGALARAGEHGGLGSCGRCRRRDRREGRQHVFLGGAAVLAGRLDGGGGDALLLGELARGRTGGGEVGAGAARQRQRRAGAGAARASGAGQRPAQRAGFGAAAPAAPASM